jgi:hypothetical protein
VLLDEEEFEDTKGLSESVNRRTQWPKEKVQRTNNDQQNIHIQLVTRNPLKAGGELRLLLKGKQFLL